MVWAPPRERSSGTASKRRARVEPATATPVGTTARPGRVAVAAVTTTVVSVMPVFLVGGLSVQIADDLHLTPATLGLAVAVYFAVTALGSFPIGLVVERFGAARTAQVGIILAADSMLAVAVSARSLAGLLVLLAVAATANSLGQLASNASLSRSVPARLHGVTLGAKQAGIPLATLLSGAAVPAVALTVGWPWAFGIGAAFAFVALALVPRDPPDPRARRVWRRAQLDAGLLALAVAAALAAGSGTTLGTFLVASQVARGQDQSGAALTLTAGGVLCVACRVLVGVLADRIRWGHLMLLTALLLAGAVGLVLLSFGTLAGVLVGVLLGYGFGWSFPGLLNYSVVRLRPQAPAAATSITQTGVYAGSGTVPLLFGVVAAHRGYASAWNMAAFAMALAGCLVIVSAALTGRSTRRRAAA
jgi:predicted MFS family arabinose efflux permease